MSGYRLFWGSGSGAYPVSVMLEKSGIAYEAAKLDLGAGAGQTPEFLAINPRGQVPTLLLPDGTVMTESVACCLAIGESNPESGLVPGIDDPARPVFLRWMVFAATQLYEDILRICCADRYTDDPDGTEGVVAAAKQAYDRNFENLLGSLYGTEPLAFGGKVTILDVYVTMLSSWAATPRHHYKQHPLLGRTVAACLADPVIAGIWERYEMDSDLPEA